MKTIYYNSNNQFKLTDEEFQKVMEQFNNGKRTVYVKRLETFLTNKFIWAGNEPEDPNIGYARENGEKFIKKYGEWKLARDPTLKVDTNYYRSVAKDNLLTKEEAENKNLLKSGKNGQRKT